MGAGEEKLEQFLVNVYEKLLVEKMGLPRGYPVSSTPSFNILRCCEWWKGIEQRIATLEFDRARKSMKVLVKSDKGTISLLVKGDVESLLERSSYIQLLDGSVVRLAESSKSLILQAVDEMSTNALCCLGFASKDVADFFNYEGEGHPAHKLLLDPSNYAFIESDLIFAGWVGLRDPPREEVYQAIEDCKAAGIRVMVITGNLSQQCLNALAIVLPDFLGRSADLTYFNMTLLQSFGDFQKATPEEENIENKLFDPRICLLQQPLFQ
ncbi:hypothetical protein KFK09_007864 [Dendrobium nobile]|uniref:Uncharacterized protein n=1 Tax=Dendrobium nobile TaxID=94219 RepID=A0A8T3BSY1_DENNO|nr:hypothetical protein KFK09_007864 [Dendrobium nobile]